MKADSALVDSISPSPNFGERRGRAVDALILHYTGMRTGTAARLRLLDPSSEVSCHYLIWEDGRIEQLVDETKRAWHAGRSNWAGETDMNAISIGLEIVNGGHDGGSPPYPEIQIDAVIALAGDICTRHSIAPKRVLGHSDVAPDRKLDPGEWFPWDRLAAAGIGLWAAPPPPDDSADLSPAVQGAAVLDLQTRLEALGYACPTSGIYDEVTKNVVAAFQRHFRPARVDGIADASTLSTLARLQTNCIASGR